MNLLGRRLFYDFPEYYGLFSRLTEDAGIAQVANTNRRFLESYRGADGIKTGYTNAAGFNLTSSAERGNKRLVATVFGGTSTANRNARMTEILDIGFGNAPANVRLAPPPPVALDEVASAATPSTVPATPGGAGKTIRLVTSRETSPRPMRRPDAVAAPPAEALAQVTSGVADVLAALTAPAETPAVAVAPPPPRPLVTEAQPAAPVAVAAAETPPPPVRPEPVPFQVVDANGATLAQPGDAAPESLADADLPDDLPSPDAEDADALPGAVRSSSPLVVPALVAAYQAKRPRARPGEIVMTVAAAPADTAPKKVERTAAANPGPAPEAEVVSRVSTSGGRHWAVTLGKFNNRGTAERALLQTALSETRALEGALRKVLPRGNGYEATFAGLTRDQADLACRRLQARAIGCFTLGP
jgi:D-alanyl-D-alanine carboxypeptidase